MYLFGRGTHAWQAWSIDFFRGYLGIKFRGPEAFSERQVGQCVLCHFKALQSISLLIQRQALQALQICQVPAPPGLAPPNLPRLLAGEFWGFAFLWARNLVQDLVQNPPQRGEGPVPLPKTHSFMVQDGKFLLPRIRGPCALVAAGLLRIHLPRDPPGSIGLGSEGLRPKFRKSRGRRDQNVGCRC